MEKTEDGLLQNKIAGLVEEALKKHVFTACSIAFFKRQGEELEGNILSYGTTGEDQDKLPVDEKTIFDLASLTKPLVTSLCVLALLAEKKIFLEDTLDKFFVKIPLDKHSIKISHLLSHSSGLPAHRPYYKKLLAIPPAERPDKLLEWILQENLLFRPGDENLYSDLGFILLGRIIEKISGDDLDELWRKKIISPLNLDYGLFFPKERKGGNGRYACTGTCQWSRMKLYGKVHDDNCRAIGGVAGHAGLFGTAEAVLSLCEHILLQLKEVRQHPAYSSKLLRDVLLKEKGPWIFGFDTPTAGISSSGKYFSAKTLGHLGFTGTSFWLDLQREIAIVFLSNRVLSGENTTLIRQFRPLLHDTIMEHLIQGKENQESIIQ